MPFQKTRVSPRSTEVDSSDLNGPKALRNARAHGFKKILALRGACPPKYPGGKALHVDLRKGQRDDVGEGAHVRGHPGKGADDGDGNPVAARLHLPWTPRRLRGCPIFDRTPSRAECTPKRLPRPSRLAQRGSSVNAR